MVIGDNGKFCEHCVSNKIHIMSFACKTELYSLTLSLENISGMESSHEEVTMVGFLVLGDLIDEPLGDLITNL